MILSALAVIVAAIITSMEGNARLAHRFLESRLGKLLSFGRNSDRKVARFKFARELKDPRKNSMLAEESTSLPSVLLFDFIYALVFVVLFMDGVLALSGVFNLRGRPPISFVRVIVLLCASAVIWKLLTWATKQFCWNYAIKYCFNNFLEPVFRKPRAPYYGQIEFPKAVQSFHTVYDDRTIRSLKRAFRLLIVIGSGLYFLASLIDTGLSVCFPGNRVLRFLPASAVFAIVWTAVVLCCLLAYYMKLEELIQKEKEKHLWYNPISDANHVRHYAILDKACEFGYWLGEAIGESKKREEQNE